MRDRLRGNGLRVRLTALYGVLFALTGATLLAITYALVRTSGPDGEIHVTVWSELDGPLPPYAPVTVPRRVEDEMRRVLDEQQRGMLSELLSNSGIALVLMTVIAVVLGWFLAGRLLRPLRTITATARDISASDLHRRLALTGPDDEIKHLGDTIDDLLARLESAFAAQRLFVANASHELRTPLARQRVLGQVVLGDPTADADALRHAHERILAAGEEQRRIIDALLVLAHGQAGLEHREPVDLAATVAAAVAARTGLAEQHSVTLCADPRPAWTEGDPQLLSQLVGNLVENAVLHNVRGGHVTVTTAADGAHSVLTVSNTGQDVTEDQLARIVQPFRRAGTDRTARAGTGLGLTIVKAIADAHAATLSLNRRPGGGLTVHITFAAAAEPEPATGARIPTTSHTSAN
ncbi:sensor histidine kinase [Actinokineospora sp. HUAS TT18]|uniref:sensor histidine kinase n=1 Tax=Actinokineospora sp. HUAS TT18 TaxID=3447451 RepID=UPI003F51CF8B